MKKRGDLPGGLIVKTSVMMAPANPASARVLEDLGATTINVPSDLTLPQLAAIRAAVDAPLDLYVEAPDNIGGFIRYYETPEFIRAGAPLYVKLGLKNAPDIYPSGTHIEPAAIALSRERCGARASYTTLSAATRRICACRRARKPHHAQALEPMRRKREGTRRNAKESEGTRRKAKEREGKRISARP